MADPSESYRSAIDDWCDRFEAEWKSAAQPKLGEYIQRWQGSGREELFRYLLELDVDYQQRVGGVASAESYRSEFPEFESIIAEVLERDKGTVSKRHGKTHPSGALTADAMPSSIGDYELLSALGQGGMGVVYKARQRGLNRLVALKMIRSREFANRDELQRFQAEAEAAASLSHPAIVPVYEVGNEQGRLYFSMELVEGGSLAERIAETPMSSSEAARLMEQIARAIAYAHEKGVIHRDLKPANILLDRQGLPRITDFGLAKRLDGDHELTATGQVLGTPSYMPPEQARGDVAAISARSDVYSLGAVLYRSIAGRPPFQAATLADTLYEVQNSDPQPPSKSARGIPRDLDTICLKCLEKSPSRRYATALELAEELGRFLRKEPIHARPLSSMGRFARWAQRKPLVASLAALVVTSLVMGTAVSTYFAYSSSISAGKANAAAQDAGEKLREANAARIREQAALVQAARELKAANDARAEKQVALTQAEAENYISTITLSHRDWLDRRPGSARERLAATNPRLRGWEYGLLESLYGAYQTRLPNDDPTVNTACFVGASSQVLTGGKGTLRLWDTTSGRLLRSLNNLGGGYVVAVTDVPDYSVWAVVLSFGKLLLVDPQEERVLGAYDLNLVKEPDTPYPPQLITATFSRDGRLLLAKQEREQPLILWDIGAGKALPSPDRGGISVDYIAISPEGKRYAVADQDRRVGIGVLGNENKIVWQKDDLAAGRIHGLAFVGDPGELFVAGVNCHYLDERNQQATQLQRSASLFAAHAEEVAAVDYEGILSSSAPLFGRSDDELRGHEGKIHSLRFSPNARQLLSVGLNHEGDRELIVWDLEQFKQRDIHYPIQQYGLLNAISPDQSRAVIGSPDPARQHELRIIDTATGKEVRSANLGVRPSQGSFSADSEWLALTTADNAQKIWGGCLKVADGEFQPLPNSQKQDVHDIRVSAGGKYIAAVLQAWEEFGHRLHVWRRENYEPLIESPHSLNYEQAFAFSSRGDKFAYNAGREVLVFDLTSSTVLHRFQLPDDKGLSMLQFSPSDQCLAGGGFSAGYVWQLDKPSSCIRLRGHRDLVTNAAFTQQEDRLLTAAVDGTIKLWQLPSGREMLTLPSHGDSYRQLSLAPDDSRLVTVSLRNTITVRQWLAQPQQKRLKLPLP